MSEVPEGTVSELEPAVAPACVTGGTPPPLGAWAEPRTYGINATYQY